MRLGIVSALAAGDEMSFTDLKAALNATDGNLSVHARKLEEAGYVACTKTFSGRTPRTGLQPDRLRPPRTRKIPRSHGRSYQSSAPNVTETVNLKLN
jgi:DNA-binding transcriptional ArsR family regulator